jgi:hypothetical protein
LAKKNSFSMQENGPTQTDQTLSTDVLPAVKKKFIEPEISTPVDVLEATTFFQAVTSGATN